VGETRSTNFVWLKLSALVLILGGLSFLLWKFGMMPLFVCKARMIEFLQSLGTWSFAGFIALQAIQVIVAPIPGEVTGILGGFLYGMVPGLILSTVGLTIGSYVAFLLSRVFGRPLAERIVPRSVMSRFDYLLESKGSFLVFLLFFIPGFPKDYFCYIFGLGKITTKEYMILSTLGRLFGTILLSLEGSYLKNDQYIFFAALAGGGLLLGLLAVVFRNRLEQLFRHVYAEKNN
jgi:uncharacterized membrane protein YdjX (TVP38/TMEM64 family)